MAVTAWTYILKCADDSFYIGWTNDLPRRLAAHNAGKGARYTRGRGPVQPVYWEEFAEYRDAQTDPDLEGADEVVFLDISATDENRGTQEAWVEEVARALSIPFTVGCGPTGMPEPLSTMVTELSPWMTTLISLARPAIASSIELSTTS